MFTPTRKQDEVIQSVLLERYRQNKKWGPETWKSPIHVKYIVLAEEFGEIAEAILNHDKKNLKEELVQVAAVCFKWLEALDEDPDEWNNHGCG